MEHRPRHRPDRRRIPLRHGAGHDAGLAEEQRLFYVALTRARDQLTLYIPLRMPHHRHTISDRHSLRTRQ